MERTLLKKLQDYIVPIYLGCEDNRAAGDLVLRATVHRLEKLPDLAQAEQEG